MSLFHQLLYLLLHLLGALHQDGQDKPAPSGPVTPPPGPEVDDPEPHDEEPPPPPPVTPPPGPVYNSRYLWCIDCGHGALTRGKRSPVLPGLRTGLPTEGQLIEYEFNRDVTERLIEMLAGSDVEYLRTMPQHGEYGNALEARVSNANAALSTKPKRGVSIHANASKAMLPGGWQDNASGPEVWHHATSWRGRAMAHIIQARLRAVYVRFHPEPWRNRGVKSTKQFFVLRATNYPNALTEAPMMNNVQDVRLLADPAFRQAWAEAHYDAIMEIEALPEPSAMVSAAEQLPPNLLELWLALNTTLAIFKPSEAALERRARRRAERLARRQDKERQRARDDRYKFLRKLRRRQQREGFTQDVFDQELADYDLHNPIP